MMDAKSILGGCETQKESVLKIGSLTDVGTKKTKKIEKPDFKRPDGMHRELYNLISSNDGSKHIQSLIPSQTIKGYRNPKVQIGKRAVYKFKWVPFLNEARKDGLQLYHWMREDRLNTGAPYVFSEMNKVINIPEYTHEEYDEHLKCDKWTKEETSYLFEICRRFDLRWQIITDRYDGSKFDTTRSMEDLKERFYAVLNELQQVRDPNAEPIGYDAEHERRRKDQLCKLWNRTDEEVEEEEQLVLELKRIETRKKERERKAQDLQKLITMAEKAPASPSVSGSGISPALGKKKGIFRQKTGSVSSTNIAANFNPEVQVSQLRFSEFRSAGAHLKSQEMKLPTNIGQKKLKNIETIIDKLKLEMNPMGSDDIVNAYNSFRSDIVLLQELKATLQTAEFDLESLRTRYQQQAGQTFDLEPRMRVSTLPEGGLSPSQMEGPGAPTSNRRITSHIELNSKTDIGNPRKRKLQQSTIAR